MIRAYAPASIGNMSVGFDLLGAAVAPIDQTPLGDVVSLEVSDGPLTLTCAGDFAYQLPADTEQNVVFQCCLYFHQQLQRSADGLHLTLHKNLPVGSGLGSSATSIVATLVALNEHYQQPFSQAELLQIMGVFEGQLSGSLHYDNVAPCFLGGIQLMTNQQSICQPIPSCEDWYWVLAFSGINVSTKRAREVMPTQVPMATAIEYAANLANFISYSYQQQWQQAASYITDVIAQPHREGLLSKFTEVAQGLTQLPLLASGISGSGPTVFAVCANLADAEQVQQYLQQEYIQDPSGFCKICKIDQQGARVLPADDE